jgi:hypothetical protein
MVHAVLPLLTDLGYACVGQVGTHIDASGFSALDPAVLPRVAGLYDVHFIAASREPADLPASWEKTA